MNENFNPNMFLFSLIVLLLLLPILTSKFFRKIISWAILLNICNLLFSIHVVFGHVVSGSDIVKQIENLAVDRNSRPLQDAVVTNCGELVRQIKGKLIFKKIYFSIFWYDIPLSVKKDKKKKKSSKAKSDDSDSDSEPAKKTKKNEKKKDKKQTKDVKDG